MGNYGQIWWPGSSGHHHFNNGESDHKFLFEQDSGLYDFSFRYFFHRRTDAEIKILVNGVEVSLVDIDRASGSGHRHGWSNDRVTIENLELRTGDVVEIVVVTQSGPAPRVKAPELDQTSAFSEPVLGEDLITNGGFEDHADLPNSTRHGTWGILANDDVTGWFAETVDNTVTLDFEGLSAGDRAYDYYAEYGVHISAEANRDGDRDWNDDMVFDARSPTGGDHDLGRASAQGNLLIISEDSDASDPDDAAAGGWIRVRFDDPTDIVSFKIVDNEERGGEVRLYNQDGHFLKRLSLPRTNDGGVALVDIDTENVGRMDIRLRGSGAIDDIVIGDKAGGAIEIQEGRVPGAPRNPKDNAVLELDSTENARISQIIDAPADGLYRLSFDYAARGFSGGHRAETSGFILFVNNVEVLREDTRAKGYNPFAVTVELQAGSNTISFQADGRSDGIGALIDNVSLRQILEPGGNAPPIAPPLDAGEFGENGDAIVIDLLQNATDADGDTLAVNAVSVSASDGRTIDFSLAPDGSILTIVRDSFDDLADGEVLEITISYEVSDGKVAVTTSATVTIDGTNDAPTIDVPASILSGSISEAPDGETIPVHQATGTIRFSDVDLTDTHVATATPDGPGYLGSLTLTPPTTVPTVNEGDVGWTFTVGDAEIDRLARGQIVTQTYFVGIDDGSPGGIVGETIEITMVGANDAPEIDVSSSQLTGNVTELADGDPGEGSADLTSGGEIAFTDIDLLDIHVADAVPREAGYRGMLTLGTPTTTDTTSDGVVPWTFSVNDADLQDLTSQDVLIQTYDVSIDDGQGGIVTQTFVITINGADDSATISGTLNGDVSEDGTLTATGAVEVEDVDAGQELVQAQADVAGQFGQFSITEDGAWSYVLDNDAPSVQALNDGETETDSFNILSADGSALETVEISIAGADEAGPDEEAPVLSLALDEDTGSGDADALTANPGLQGLVTDNVGVTGLFVTSIRSTTGEPLDVSSALQPDGTFILDETLLELASGGPLEDGIHTYSVFATDAAGNRSGTQTLLYTLDRSAPQVVSAPEGILGAAPSHLEIVFDEPIPASAFASSHFSLTMSDGSVVDVTSVVRLSPTEAQLNLASALPNGGYSLAVDTGISDRAGNALGGQTQFDFSVSAPTRLVSVAPSDGTRLVNLDREIIIEFDRPVDPSTVTTDSFQVLANGEPLDGFVRVSANGRLATFFLDENTILPASTELRIRVDGNQILDTSGAPVDADGDGVTGGLSQTDFSTVSLTRIPDTNLEGFIFDSNNRGPAGEDLPLEGVIVTVVGLPGVQAVTDANGRFLLEDLPVPDVYLHFDASPVSAETGFEYGTIVKPGHTVAGQTVSMTTPDGTPFNIYFAAIPDSDAVAITPGEETEAVLGDFGLQNLAENFPEIDPTEWQKLKVIIPGDALFFEDGSPATSVTVMAFEPDRIPAPTPQGFDPRVVFTVMAGGATNVDGKAQIEFPNLDGLAPGERRPIMSFDHDAGAWVRTGTAVVSADGSRLLSEGDTGINTLGWKYLGSNPVVRHTHQYVVDEPKDELGEQATSGLSTSLRNGLAAPINGVNTVVAASDFLTPVDEFTPAGPALTATKFALGNAATLLANGELTNADLAISTATAAAGTVPFTSTVGDGVSVGLGVKSTAENLIQVWNGLGDLHDGAIGRLSICGDSSAADNFGPAVRERLGLPPLPAPLSQSAGFAAFAALAGDPLAARAADLIAEMDLVILDEARDALALEANGLRSDVTRDGRTFSTALEAVGGTTSVDVNGLLDRIAALSVDFEAAIAVAQSEFLALAEAIEQGPGDDAEKEAAYEAASEAFIDAIVAAIETRGSTYTTIVHDLADAARAIFDDYTIALEALVAEVNTWVDTFLVQLPANAQVEPLLQSVGDALRNGEDATIFVDDLRDVADAIGATQDIVNFFGFADLHEWQESLRARFAAFADSAGDISLPLTTSDVDVFALAVLEDGTEIRAKLSAGEPFEFNAPAGETAIVRIFDPANNLYSESSVALGETDSSARSYVLEELTEDTDGDGIPDLGEEVIGSNPDNADTDGDGVLDGAEVAQGDGVLDNRPLPTGIVGSVALEGEALDVVVEARASNPTDRVAYVATGTKGLAIIEISSLANPIVSSQTVLPGTVESIAVDMAHNRVYAAAGAEGLHIVDVSDHVAPVISQTIALPGGVDAVALVDGLVLAGGSRIALIDGVNGAIVRQTEAAGQVEDMVVRGNIVYAVVTNGPQLSAELRTYEVSVLGITQLDSVVVPTPPVRGQPPEKLKLSVDGDIAYVTTAVEILEVAPTRPLERGGYQTFDVSDATDLSLISGIDTGDNQAANFETITNGNGLALVASGTLGLGLFDASDPQNTFDPITLIDTPGEARGVAVAGGIAFVADGSDGLQIVNYLAADTLGQAPQISLSAPDADIDPGQAGVQIEEGARIQLALDVSDDVQISQISLKIDGQVIKTVLSAPFDLNFNAPAIDGQPVSIDVVAEAIDTGGNVAVSQTLTFEIVPDSLGPEVLGISPGPGSVLSTDARTFSVTFSEPVDELSLARTALRLIPEADPGNPFIADEVMLVPLGAGLQTARFSFRGDLPIGRFSVEFDPAGVRDLAGNLASPTVLNQDFEVREFTSDWLSPLNGFWSDAINWNTGVVPGLNDIVNVALDTGSVATIDEVAGSIASLTISGEGTLFVATPLGGIPALSTDQLTNSGNLDVNFGRVEITGQTANTGTLAVSGRGTVQASGDIENSGRIEINGAFTNIASFRTNAPVTMLTGGGVIALNDPDFDVNDETDSATAVFSGTDIIADGGVIDQTFINVDNTITGSGEFGVGFNFENGPGGTVLAEDDDIISINTGRMDNDGLVKAEIGGLVRFLSDQQFFFGGLFTSRAAALIDNTDGTIWADGGQIRLRDSTVSGGNLLSSSPDGNFGTISFTGGTISGVASQVNANANILTFDRSFIEGDIANAGTFFIGNPGIVNDQGTFEVIRSGVISLSQDTVLSGGGAIDLQRHATAEANGFDAYLTTDIADEIFDPVSDELISTTGFSLTLEDQTIRGRGTVGTSFAEDLDAGGLEDPSQAPRLGLTVSQQSVIDGNNNVTALTLNNVDLANDGLIQATFGGVLEIVDSAILNTGTIWAKSGSVEIRDDFVFGGGDDFVSTGTVRASGGSDLTISKDFENRGFFEIFGDGVATVEGFVSGGALGQIAIGDGTLVLSSGTDNDVDLSLGDAGLVLEDSSFFFGEISDFEQGDAITLADIDPFDIQNVGFQDFGAFGELTIESLFSTATLTFEGPATGFGADPTSRFFFEESGEFGGTEITTDYLFV